MTYPLITVPDKRLRQTSVEVKPDDPKILNVIGNLAETLLVAKDPPGVGLAAPQVGLNQQLLLLNLPPVFDLPQLTTQSDQAKINVIINPKIISVSKKTTLGADNNKPTLEGCLSVPNLYGSVFRPTFITLSYHTIAYPFDITNPPTFTQVTHTFANFYARVFMHEYDHLNGILFTDYTKSQNQPLYFDQNDELILVQDPSQILIW